MLVDKLNLEDYNYSLQKKNIALYPTKKRENSNLLVYKSKIITETLFNNIINYIPKDSTIFFNDTKVIKSRFLFNKSQNIIIEILVIDFINLNKNSVEIDALIGNNRKWKENEYLILVKDSIKLKAIKKDDKVILTWNKKKNWNGDCFVFDQRDALNSELEETEIEMCFICREPLSKEEQESKDYKIMEYCPYCINKNKK